MKKWLYAILFLFASQMSWANGDTLSIAEQNAQQGFNDNINRLAPDFVDVYVVVSTPGDVLYSILGHAALHMFADTFHPHRSIIVGPQGISAESFLSIDLRDLFE